jgi:hypothetical protein
MLLRNLDIKEIFKRWCDCHTCFVKLPVVTILLVIVITFLGE